MSKKIPLAYKEMPIYDKNYNEIGTHIFWSRDFLEIKAFGNHEGENYFFIKVVNQNWELQRNHKPCPPLDFIVKESDIDELIQVYEGNKEPVNEVTKGMLNLLMAVIADVTNDYRLAWINGAKHKLCQCEMFLTSGKVELWTLGEYHSDFILTNLKNSLMEQYGDFNVIYQKKVDMCNEKLKPIYEQLDLYDRNYLIDTRMSKSEATWFKDFEHRNYLFCQYAKKIRDLEDKLIYEYVEIEKNGRTSYKQIVPLTNYNMSILKEMTDYKKKKKELKITTEGRKTHTKLERIIELTKFEKAKVKALEKKAEPWELLLNE